MSERMQGFKDGIEWAKEILSVSLTTSDAKKVIEATLKTLEDMEAK